MGTGQRTGTCSSQFLQVTEQVWKAQGRLEEVEEELSPVADHLGKSKVKGNEMMQELHEGKYPGLLPNNLALATPQMGFLFLPQTA